MDWILTSAQQSWKNKTETLFFTFELVRTVLQERCPSETQANCSEAERGGEQLVGSAVCGDMNC